MFELFPDQPVYEYPQLVNITYGFIWAFILSSLIAITHRLTFIGTYYPNNFFQSLVLGAVVTSLVMMAIGDSLARGLGVFGAMAIIRFRTRVDDPRDVLFLFAALSTGLAIGVYGYTISFVGTIIFCLIAFMLHASPFRSFTHNNQLTFLLEDGNGIRQITNLLDTYCMEYRELSILQNADKQFRYQYAVTLKKNISTDDLIKAIQKVEGVIQLKLASNETINR